MEEGEIDITVYSYKEKRSFIMAKKRYSIQNMDLW